MRITIKTATLLPEERTWFIASPLFHPCKRLGCKWKPKRAALMRFPALRNQKARISFAGCRLQSPNLFQAAQQWRWANEKRQDFLGKKESQIHTYIVQLEPILPGQGPYLGLLPEQFSLAFDHFGVWLHLQHSTNENEAKVENE